MIPPKPDRYFNDYAHVVSPDTAERLNHQLAEFERESSNQIVVAIYPKMQSDSDLADYTYRIKDAWKVGQAKLNNGAVLFIFVQDRKMYIQTGYGLEGALPDATCFDIYNNVIKPKFRANDYDGGVTAGVNAMIAATRGEYKGTGHTQSDRRNQGNTLPPVIMIIIFSLLLIRFIWAVRRGFRYSSFGGPYVSGGWGGSSGGWSSGSSGGWSSSDSFSGGGGIGGGGGAGGSW